MSEFKPAALVLYKQYPAIIDQISDDKYELILPQGKRKKVRAKDISLLHPGPIKDLKELEQPLQDQLQEALQLLQGETVNLEELSELIYGEYSPASAWASWQLIDQDLYFTGSLDAVQARSIDEIERLQNERQRKEQEKQAWNDLLERLKQQKIKDEDRDKLKEIEKLALEQSSHSRILAALGLKESPEVAHEFLLKLGYWNELFNPHPIRQGVKLSSPDLPVPELPVEERLDLTHLEAWAIDDEGNTDPDDAISLDGERIWVHIADVAALVAPNDELDLEARSRGANLYLPEQTITMLPAAVTQTLGMGLQTRSPALSFGFKLDEQAQPSDIQIQASWVQVKRISYAQAEKLIPDQLQALYQLTQNYHQARLARNATEIHFPEVNIKLVDGRVVLKKLPPLLSRQMVANAMLMAGEAAARFAQQHQIPIPYISQPEPSEIMQPKTLAEFYAYRRLLKPSHASLNPEPHFGLGLPLYTRATSPLRRYADLLVHQQIRHYLSRGQAALDEEQIKQHLAEANAVIGSIRRAERLSNLHWKLVYLKQNPQWQGEAIIVQLEERKATVILPDLGMECKIRRHADFELDQSIQLRCQAVDLANQIATFKRI